jgi:hypothetical protein
MSVRTRPLVSRLSGLFLTGLMLAGTLGACGFRLQGATTLPPEMGQTRLEVQNPYSTFARRLLILLEQNDVRVVTSADAGAVLEIPVNRVRKEVLTIGDNARVREYRVRHVIFSPRPVKKSFCVTTWPTSCPARCCADWVKNTLPGPVAEPRCRFG